MNRLYAKLLWQLSHLHTRLGLLKLSQFLVLLGSSSLGINYYRQTIVTVACSMEDLSILNLPNTFFRQSALYFIILLIFGRIFRINVISMM